MGLVRVVPALVAALVVAPAMAAPLTAYGKLPSIEGAAISPSGHALAMVLTDGEKRTIVVRDLAQNKVLLSAPTGSVKLRGLEWAGDKHLLLVTSATTAPIGLVQARGEWFMGFVLDLERGRVRPLLDEIGKLFALNSLAGPPQVRFLDGKPVIFLEGIVYEGRDPRLSLFRQDVGSTATRLIETGETHTTDWVVGVDGRGFAQERYDPAGNGRWSVRVRSGAGWREVMAADGLDTPWALGLGRDGQSVIIGRNDEERARAVWQETGADGPVGGEIPASDNQTAIYDPGDGRLIGYSVLVGDELRYTFFHAADAQMWRSVGAAYPGDILRLVSWSRDRRKVVVLADSPTEGPAYALVDLGAKTGQWIGAEYADLDVQDISPKQAVRFKAADGLELTGYLTLPRGKPAKNLPLVVFPHGGPASRDTPGFDWWAQGMASRGYAVLQVNFRGSDGFGAKLLQAGYGQWGRKMQTDLSDGVRHLAAQGIIDPKRVCIVGASYGGYAALAGATLDRGVYRCAASVAGVSDLRRIAAEGGRTARRYWLRFMGSNGLGDPVLATYSPAAHADKAEIPILLIHGKDDTVVPLEHSRIMADALKKAGKPHELVVQPGADHWLSRGDTRLQTLESVVAFLEKHNPPN